MFFKLHGLEGKVNLGKGICYFMMKLFYGVTVRCDVNIVCSNVRNFFYN